MKVDIFYVQEWFGEAAGAAIIDWAVPLSILFAIPVMIGIGFAMERGLIKHFYKRPHADQILVTFGLAIVLQEVIKYFYGANPIPTPAPEAFRGSFDFGMRPLGSTPTRSSIPIGGWSTSPSRRHHRRRLRLPAVHHLRHGGARRHGRPRDGGPAGHRHRQALYHHVRRRGRRRGACGGDVRADQLAELPHGHGLSGAELRGGRRRRHGVPARRGAGGVPARASWKASPRWGR